MRQTPRLRAIAAETSLQEEDERPHFSGVLRKGYLRTERYLQDGRRSVLGFLAPGDLIGESLGSGRGPALIAASDAEICDFDPTALRRALQDDPWLNARVLAEAARQHTRQLEMIWRRGALSSRERIIAFIVMATEFMPVAPQPDGSLILSIKVSRRDWADFTSTTVETICRTLAQLAGAGLVDMITPARCRIMHLDVLAREAGLDTRRDCAAMLVDTTRPAAGPVRKAADQRMPQPRAAQRNSGLPA